MINLQKLFSKFTKESFLEEFYNQTNNNPTLGKIKVTITDIEKDSPNNWRAHELQKIYYANGGAKVGMGATISGWSDSHPCTIVSISKSGKKITVQMDKATLSPDFKPEIILGGFLGHCVNQDEQNYTYEKNPDGEIRSFSLRNNLQWVEVGQKINQGASLNIGLRRKFHDYNF